MTKRFPWDGDNVVAGGKTSIAVVLGWLGGSGNYDRWRTAQSARGHSISSIANGSGPHVYKIELAREILRELAAHGITHRLARDVRWKINTFCRGYAAAALYLREYEQLKPEQLRKATAAANAVDAQRVMDNNEQRVMTHVYNLCPYFDVLDPIMKYDVENLQAAEQERKRKKCSAQEKKSRASSDDEADENDDDENGQGLSEDDSPFGSFITPEPTRLNNSKRRSMGGSLDEHDNEAEQQQEKSFKKRKRELLLENLAFDNELKRIKIERERLKMAKQVALGRKQMLDAGIPLDQVDALFSLLSSEPDTETE